jgi:hypothetical protein
MSAITYVHARQTPVRPPRFWRRATAAVRGLGPAIVGDLIVIAHSEPPGLEDAMWKTRSCASGGGGYTGSRRVLA